jgi:hypothetical protein
MEAGAKGNIYVYMCVFFFGIKGGKKERGKNRKKNGIKTSKVDRPVSKHLRNQRIFSKKLKQTITHPLSMFSKLVLCF